MDVPPATTLEQCHRRTLLVKTPNGGQATAFVLTRGESEWLVTAGHVADRWSDGTIRVFGRDGNELQGVGKRLPVESASHKDVAAFRFDDQPDFGPPLRAETGAPGLAQAAYFTGFPDLGLGDRLSYADPHVPFIKSAVVSGRAKDQEGTEVWILDATNIPGFSGGPVLTLVDETKGYRPMAVVSAYVPLREDGDPENAPCEEPFDDCAPRPLQKPSAGFAVAFDIQHALSAIDRKSGGSPLE